MEKIMAREFYENYIRVTVIWVKWIKLDIQKYMQCNPISINE